MGPSKDFEGAWWHLNLTQMTRNSLYWEKPAQAITLLGLKVPVWVGLSAQHPFSRKDLISSHEVDLHTHPIRTSCTYPFHSQNYTTQIQIPALPLKHVSLDLSFNFFKPPCPYLLFFLWRIIITPALWCCLGRQIYSKHLAENLAHRKCSMNVCIIITTTTITISILITPRILFLFVSHINKAPHGLFSAWSYILSRSQHEK